MFANTPLASLKRGAFFSQAKKVLTLILIGAFVSCQNNRATVSTYAGNGKPGAANGKITDASFYNLMGLAVDSGGSVFVADSRNNLIRKISADGMVSTLAGNGAAGKTDGPAAKASFTYPMAVAVDSKGNVYVCDTQNNLIRKISTDGTVSTIAGALTDANKNHPEDTTRFDNPKGIVADKQGNVYFTDFGRDVIRKITPDGKITVFAGDSDRGAKDGKGTAASFYLPTGLAIDDQGNLFVADTYNNTIRKIDPGGMVTTIAGKPAPQGKRNGGAKDGKGPAAQFRHPFGIAVDHNDNVYVADVGNQKIRKISPDGVVTTIAGAGRRAGDNGEASKASFYNPYGVAVDKQGNVYIADYQNNVVRKLSF